MDANNFSLVKGPPADIWNTLEGTMLDQGVSYPPDMVGVVTSTPNLRRSSRRSWFEGPPGLKLAEENADEVQKVIVEPKVLRKTRRQSEEMETLLLTHFTNPPRIGFGEMKPNQTKSRTLLIRNPHDYEQSVKIEKVPTKKNFAVDQREFTVDGGEVFELTIDWTPTEPCSVREMILFLVDGSYRVQAYVFGSVDAPPAKKKVRRGGLLSKKVTKPFSVIQTASLANIDRSYSPEKNMGVPKKMQPPVKAVERRRSPRLKKSDPFTEIYIAENKRQLKKKSLEKRTVVNSAVENAENCVPNCEPKIPKKKMRRSNTYSNVSGVGLTIPIINGETVEGHTSVLDVPDADDKLEPCPAENRKSEVVAASENCVALNRIQQDVSLTTIQDDISVIGKEDVKEMQTAQGSPVMIKKDSVSEESLMLTPAACPGKIEPPSFIQTPGTGGNAVEPPSFLSPNTFLENSMIEKLKQSAKNGGELSNCPVSPITDSVERKEDSINRGIGLSPNSFLQDMKSIKAVQLHACSPDKIPSPECVLNDSIPHNIMMKQLGSVRKSLHEQSSEIEFNSDSSQKRKSKAIKPCTKPKLLERKEVFLKKRSSPRFSSTALEKNSEHGLFLSDAKKAKVLQQKAPATSSPRRTTFTVLKQRSTPPRRRAATSPAKCLTRLHSKTDGPVFKLEGVLEKTEDIEVIAEDNSGNTPLLSNRGEQKVASSSRTVTKDKPVVTGDKKSRSGKSLVLNKEASIISDDGVFDTSSEFHSPVNLPQTEIELQSKRSSLTVTKSRPSDVLMSAVQKHSKGTCLFKPIEEPSGLNSEVEKEKFYEIVSADDKKSANISATDLKYQSVNSSVEKSNSSSFLATPHQLPSSPNPDHSRRSTHILREPKVLDINQMEKKQLFPPLEVCDHDAVVEKDSLEESENSVTDDMNEADENAKKTVETENESKAPEKEENTGNGLFFIPIEKKPVEKPVLASKTEKPKPHVFLKRRSVATLDKVVTRPPKRTKSTTESLTQNQPQVVTRARVQSARLADKPRTSERLERQVLKPKLTGKGLPQSKLILVKKSKSALPKHPLPFAAKNMYYDERWMEKQERGFVNWLNFILTPAEECQSSNVKVKVDAGKLSLDVAKGSIKLAPTNEVLSFRAYAARRRLNRLRRSACKLFQSEEVIMVIQKLESEVESRRLAVRKDKMMHADLGVKQKILDMLLSYNPLWLRIGLETIFGEVLPLQSNSDAIGLSRFVLTRFLNSPDISAEFAHPTVPHLYRDGYAEMMAQYTLKKFLMLVYFLDQAKQARLIDHNPCLFCKDSEFKTSKSLFLLFSRDYLAGEGDITRHLGYLGCKVTYTQTPLEEFDFAVTNLATDLRDGLRLTRVLEFLCNKPELSKTLRVPAISRLQKIHNVEVVFKTLIENDIQPEKVEVRDVVDGHREKTLRLLWTVILHYQVEMLLNEEQLKEEIKLLQRNLKVRNQLQSLLNYEQDLKERRESAEPDLHTKNERLNLLLKWCRAVCAFYDIKIENFTVSFSDGRALCFLVHHYHPALLPLKAVKQQTTVTYLEDMEKKAHNEFDVSLNDSCSSPAVFPDMGDPVVFEKLMSNEKENFKTLFEKVKELGGVPLMLKWSDMSNTIPDEKVVVTYLMYLCARLLDVRQESRAARVIQLAWRHYKLRKQKALMKAKYEDVNVQKAIVVMQATYRMHCERRRFLKVRQAASVVQGIWRKRAMARKERQRFVSLRKSAVKIQSIWRMYKERLVYREYVENVAKIQSAVRMFVARKEFQRKMDAVLKIQRWFQDRRHIIEMRKNFLRQRNAALTLQAGFRAYKQRQMYLRQRAAIVQIQSFGRALLARKQLREMKKKDSAVRTIQQRWRATRLAISARRDFLQVKHSVVVLQQSFRAVQVMKRERSQYRQLKSASICIQAFYRGMVARKQLKMQKAALKIQSAYRAYKERQRFLKIRQRIVSLQSLVRMKRARQRYINVKKAVLLLQMHVRAKIAAEKCRYAFLVKKGAAITLQAAFKGHQVRKHQKQLKSAAVVLQAWCRGYLQRLAYKKIRKAAITIQAAFRGHLVRRHQKRRVSAVVKLQSHVRSFLLTRKYQKLRMAAIFIQQNYRAVRQTQAERAAFVEKKHSAIVIQASFRSWIGRRQYLKLKSGVTKLQAVVRQVQTRRRFLVMKKAVILAQSTWRMHRQRKAFQETLQVVVKLQSVMRMVLERRRFLKKKTEVMKIQQWYRGCTEMIRMKNQLTKKRRAATVIQATFRSYKQRRAYLKQREAVVKIQALARSVFSRCRFQEMKRRDTAARTIQQKWRATVLSRSERREFLQVKHAAIVLQRSFRALQTMKADRERFRHLKMAAIKIQASVRAYRSRKKYLSVRRGIILIQAVARMRQARAQYQRLLQAVSVIQKRVRAKIEGEITRYSFLVKKGAAMTIQAAYKGHLVRKYQKQLKSATIIVQQRYRAKKQTSKVRNAFIEKKESAILIQATVRSWICRKEFLRTKSSVAKLQACVRQVLARRRFIKMKEATVLIQSTWRMYQQQIIYQNTVHDIVAIQSFVRTFLARKKFCRTVEAVVCIQKWYRNCRQMQQLKKDLARTQSAAVTIQACFRGYRQRKEYLRQRMAVICLQSLARGILARKCYEMKKKNHTAALCIQRKWKATILARSARQKFLTMKQSVIVLQQWYRAIQLMKSESRQYQQMKAATVCIQSCYRGLRARRQLKMEKAACTIQSVFKMYKTRKQYRSTRQSAIFIQSFVRMRQVRKSYQKVKQAVNVLQKHVRAKIEGNRCKYDFLVKKGAAITIQAAYKGHRVRKHQKQLVLAATRIQARVRGRKQYREYQRLKQAVVSIQQRYRAVRLAEEQRRMFLTRKWAVILVQTFVRGWSCRRHYLQVKTAVTRMQASVRMVQARQKFVCLKNSAILIQRQWRTQQLTKQCMSEYRKVRQAVIRIQAAFRGRQGRQRYREMLAAVQIQSWTRMVLERRRYQKTREKIVRIQNCLRTLKVRQEFLALQAARQKKREGCLARMVEVTRRHLAVIRLQRAWRKHQMLKIYQHRLQSVKVIQSWMRAKLTRLHYLRDRQRICKLQAVVRTWLRKRNKAAAVIQGAVRKWLVAKSVERKIKAVVKLQALWRGYCLRKQCRSKRMSRIRQRVQEATATATEEKTLGNRTTSALDYLLKYKQLSHILDAVMHLEVATRLSSVCCERMVEVNAVCVLYKLVRCCNRSLPHMEIIKYTVSILLNLAKYEKTRSSVYEVEDGISTLIELMQIYREKGQIFVKTCTLLGILALSSACKTAILGDKKIVEKLRSIQNLTARKHKIEENHRITRAKMNATFTVMPRSPMKKHRIKPDWLLHKDRMNDIENPLKAINFVFQSLGLK